MTEPYSITEIARTTGVSRTALYREIESCCLAVLPGEPWFVAPAELDRWKAAYLTDGRRHRNHEKHRKDQQ